MSEMNKINFNHYKTGSVSGVCGLVKISEELQSKTGNPYINLTLYGEDNTKKQVAVFTKREDFKIPEKTVIEATFSYKGDYLNISNIKAVEGGNINEYIKAVNGQEYYDKIIKTLDTLNYESDNITLYTLTKAVLNKHKKRLLVWPASEYMHHSYIGGFVFHLCNMMMNAYYLTDGRYNIDREVVVCAALLSNICKLYTLDSDGFTSESNIYNFTYNNGEFSLKMVEDVKPNVEASGKKINEDKFLNLSICIKSYKGKGAWGSSITPLTEEAYLNFIIHSMDVNLDVYEEIRKKTEKGKLSDYSERLYTRVLNI